MRRARALLLLCASAVMAGCAGDYSEPMPFETALDVWNRSNFELLRLYVHNGPSYAGAADELAEPLAVEAHTVVDFRENQRVTVVRQKSKYGEQIAMTTAVDLEVASAGYTLIVFDEAFRLMEPGYSD